MESLSGVTLLTKKTLPVESYGLGHQLLKVIVDINDPKCPQNECYVLE